MRRLGSRGATLIEVLIAVLVLSFGLLFLSGVLAMSVQMPKAASYRAVALNIAAAHVDKMRANFGAFQAGDYARPSSYDATFNPVAVKNCAYPYCSATDLAEMDWTQTARAARLALPAGGVLVACDPQPCDTGSHGNIWVIWQEPAFTGSLDNAASDQCPSQVTDAYPQPAVRCVYLRFKP